MTIRYYIINVTIAKKYIILFLVFRVHLPFQNEIFNTSFIYIPKLEKFIRPNSIIHQIIQFQQKKNMII